MGFMFELEVVILLCSMIAGLGFCVGSYISPVTKHLKTHIRFLEGKVNRYKQDVAEENSNKTDGLDDLINSNPLIKTAVAMAGGKEKAIEIVLSKIDLSKILGKDKPKDSGQVYS